MSLADTLRQAAVGAIAETAPKHPVRIDQTAVDDLARVAVIAVLDELASREQAMRDVSPEMELTTSRSECAGRITDYQEAAGNLRSAGRP